MLVTWSSVILLLSNVYAEEELTLFKKGILPLVKFERRSYFFSTKFKIDYFSAVYICHQMGMQLLSIPSREVDEFVVKTIKDVSDPYWTSGTKLVDGKDWYWLSTAELFSYTNWLPNEPNKLDVEHCVQLLGVRGKIQWNNVACNYNLNFICESFEFEDEDDDFRNVFMDPQVSPNFPIFKSGTHVYYVGKEEVVTYWEAHIFCNALFMTLVKINSKEENDYIYKYIRDTNAGKHFWSGGITFLDSVYWYWLPSKTKVLYTNWMKGKPHTNTSSEYCIQLTYNEESGLVWTDEKCSTKLYFICKSPIGRSQRLILGYPNKRSIRNNHKVRSGPYYYIGKEKATYDQAVKKCKDMGLKLVSLQNNAKQHAVNRAIKNSDFKTDLFWTSGNINKITKNWHWLSEVITKFFWKSKQTNITETEECLSIMVKREDILWYNAPCSQQYYYICE